MAPQVKVLPSGRKFFVEGRESILDAGLRAGLNLPYGCANGNCGNCLARLVSGGLKKIRHYDFHVSEAEKTQGYFLTCSHAPLTDIEIEVKLTSSPGEIPAQDIIGKIKKIEPLSDQVMALQVRLARADKLQFLAGQRVVLGGNDALPEIELSIASCPCNAVNLAFHVPLLPEEPFSEQLFAGAIKIGQPLRIRGPKGQFVLFEDLVDVPSPKRRNDEFTLPPLLFLSWHTGFAPVRSLIEHALSFETETPLYLYRLSPTPDDIYLDNLCRSWQDVFDHFYYHPLPYRYTLMSSRKEADAIIEEIAARHENLADFNVYVAGPEPLVESAAAIFPAAGVPAGGLKTEIVCLGFCDERTPL